MSKMIFERKFNTTCTKCGRYESINDVSVCSSCWIKLTPQDRSILGYPDERTDLSGKTVIYVPNPGAKKIVFVTVLINMLLAASAVLAYIYLW